MTSGAATAPRRGAPRRRLSPTEAAGRNFAIVARRASGATWPVIAAEFGLTERGCRDAAKEHREAVGSSLADVDSVGVIEDAIEQLDLVLERAVEGYEATPPSNPNGRVGGLRTVLGVLAAKTSLLGAIGSLDEALVASRFAGDADAFARAGDEVLREVAAGRVAAEGAVPRFLAVLGLSDRKETSECAP